MKIKDVIVHKNGQKAIIVEIFQHIDCKNSENDGLMYRVLFCGKRKFKYITERIIKKNWVKKD